MSFKRPVAALIAAVMAIGMVSCGNSSSDDDDEDETSAASVETKEATAEPEVSETQPSEAEADPPETVAETAEPAGDIAFGNYIDPNFDQGTYSNGAYSISADESKWEYVPVNMVNSCSFTYRVDSEEAQDTVPTITVSSVTEGPNLELSAEEYSKQWQEVFSQQQETELISAETEDLNGYECYHASLEYLMEGIPSRFNHIVITHNGIFVIITYSMAEEMYDKISSDVDEVLSSLVIN